MIVTVFRSRLRDNPGDYHDTATRMLERASSMPGFVDFKSFTADDGERVSIITFESADTQRAWREHAEHREAQRRGRDEFYAEYSIQVCEVLHERKFSVADNGPAH